jgi:hypothetical protein
MPDVVDPNPEDAGEPNPLGPPNPPVDGAPNAGAPLVYPVVVPLLDPPNKVGLIAVGATGAVVAGFTELSCAEAATSLADGVSTSDGSSFGIFVFPN